MLQFDNVCVNYGEVQALWDVTISVIAGSLVAVIGSNGAGKTTTLRAISGLVKPKTGRIIFQGTDIRRLAPHQIVALGIAHVPEGRKLFPQLSVYENLVLGSLTPHAKAIRHQQLEFVTELFPIVRERRNQEAGTLSGGEQQMVAIARGLMSAPKLLMLDEPSLGLAPKIVETVFEIISKIKQSGVTVLLVEQNTNMSLRLADRGFVLENGRLALVGTGLELLQNPHVKKAYLGF